MRVMNMYKNGNYTVMIFDDGTKIRQTFKDDFSGFVPKFPESIDLKITNKCPYMCEYCHENSKPDGEEAILINKDENGNLSFAVPFLNTLVAGTELAIGGGSVMTHSQLDDFLTLLKQRKIIANFTVNQRELMTHMVRIQKFIDDGLVNGVGISYLSKDERLIEFCNKNPNAVIHIINGIVSEDDMKFLVDKNLKVLVLGYKDFRRGSEFHTYLVDMKKEHLRNNIGKYMKQFKVMSFDNLAITQLDIKKVLGESTFNKMYMGDDGQFTMYIDLPNNKFAPSSIQPEYLRHNLLDNIIDMFNVVRKEKQ